MPCGSPWPSSLPFGACLCLNETLELGWRKHGVHPRSLDGLRGILTYPFLHGDWGHLWNNTMSFFTLNGFLFYFYRSIAFRVWLWLFLLSGTMLWGLAVDGNHIGASGLIYGLAAFLFTSGVIRNNRLLLRVSLAVAFLYGGIVWWMLAHRRPRLLGRSLEWCRGGHDARSGVQATRPQRSRLQFRARRPQRSVARMVDGRPSRPPRHVGTTDR